MARQQDDPTVPPGAGRAPENVQTLHTSAPKTEAPETPILLDPSDAEIEQWAERERKRREAWLRGPTQEEKAAWARRERARRLAEVAAEQEKAAWERQRPRPPSPREAQLAAEGAASLLWKWSWRGLGILMRAGRAWEEEFFQPSGRRRVPIDDEGR